MLILGPCSAESRTQMLEIGRQLRGRADYLRAGVWKPRTRCGSFSGVGEPALAWLVEAAKLAEATPITEVELPEHVDLAAEAGLRAVWLGARSVCSPALIDALAERLALWGVSAWVKNPIAPCLELWIGAIERLEAYGVEVLGAIFRGVKSLEPTRYRNTPAWQIAQGVRIFRPTLPLLCDLSHIAGKRDLLADVASEARATSLFSGLMIEVHARPNDAITDAKQQVTPQEVEALIGRFEDPK